MLRFLFYRNRFRQVSRFIHIEASADRYVVAKELQRNDRQGVCKNRICLRQVNYVVGYFFHFCIANGRYRHDKRASCLHFLNIADRFLVELRLSQHSYDKASVLNQGNGSVFQLTGCIRLGMDVGNLFQLQGVLALQPVARMEQPSSVPKNQYKIAITTKFRLLSAWRSSAA